jgi:diacylglycerol kinase family enzyme
MKYFFILNPGSRGGRSRHSFARVLDTARQRRVNFDFGLTRDLNHAYNLSRWANQSGYQVIVAVGGDGTINKVLNGFYDETGKMVSGASLGVLHTGTSPDFCKSHAIPYRLDRALDTLFCGSTKKIQVVKITLAQQFDPSFEGKPISDNPIFQTRYFACCANIGLGAAIARSANDGIRKRVGDLCGTFISLLRSLARYEQSTFSIIRDGYEQTVHDLVNLSIGKTFHIASGIKVRNELQEKDRRCYCLTIRDLRTADLLPCLWSLYGGKPIENKRYARLEYCTSVQILGNNQCPEVEFDGDPQGFLPCRIETAADQLDLIGELS